MIDEREDGARDVSCPHRRPAPSGRRRVLPVQALLRRLPVHAGPGAGVDDRLPASDAAIARDPGQGRQGANGRARCWRAPTCRARSRRRSRRLVNRADHVEARPRTVMEKATGIAQDRLLPSFANVRFSKWFRAAPRRRCARSAARARVALFPTCLVEYQEPAIGKALVGVCERNGVACDLPEGQVCCGMPWLDAGDVEKFEDARPAQRRACSSTRCAPVHDVVVPQPTCAYVMKHEYPDFLGTDDARLVAEHTFDVVRVPDAAAPRGAARHRRSTGTHVRDDHLARRLPLPGAADRARRASDLMALTGAEVTMVERCSAIDGTWGLRAENVEMAREDRQAADGGGRRSPTPTSSPATATWRTPRSGGHRQASRAPDAGARPRVRARRRIRGRHAEADHRRHQGPARVRARAGRRSAPRSSR